MRDFKTVFAFEFKTQMAKRTAIVTTLVIMIIVLLVTSLPRIISLFSGGGDDQGLPQSAISGAGYVKSEGEAQALLETILGKDAPSYPDREALVKALNDKEVEVGFVVNPEDLSYEALYQDKSMEDRRDMQFGEILTSHKREKLMVEKGLSAADYQDIQSANAEGTTTILGQNSMSNYMITFLLMLLVYMIVLIYGSSVSSIIAREKDSRTMEILITSTRPTQLIIGKVMAAGLAAVIQFGFIILAGVVGFQLNKSTYPPEILMMVSGSITTPYLLTYLFFTITGFILYLFLYAALGSTVSKMEDLPSATSLVQFLFIAGYILASFTANIPNSAIAVAGSIIPFTSVMVMPLRVGVSTVPTAELIIAGVLMIAFVVFFAYLSIKIYRWGSLNYGNKTKLSRIIKEALKHK
ncbi:MAG: ABC transporter permease [Bacillota bacterium]|nr:ABC transporter permease [Bacillota bacterium]